MIRLYTQKMQRNKLSLLNNLAKQWDQRNTHYCTTFSSNSASHQLRTPPWTEKEHASTCHLLEALVKNPWTKLSFNNESKYYYINIYLPCSDSEAVTSVNENQWSLPFQPPWDQPRSSWVTQQLLLNMEIAGRQIGKEVWSSQGWSVWSCGLRSKTCGSMEWSQAEAGMGTWTNWEPWQREVARALQAVSESASWGGGGNTGGNSWHFFQRKQTVWTRTAYKHPGAQRFSYGPDYISAWTEDVEGRRGCQPRVLTFMSLTWNFKVPPE